MTRTPRETKEFHFVQVFNSIESLVLLPSMVCSIKNYALLFCSDMMSKLLQTRNCSTLWNECALWPKIGDMHLNHILILLPIAFCLFSSIPFQCRISHSLQFGGSVLFSFDFSFCSFFPEEYCWLYALSDLSLIMQFDI